MRIAASITIAIMLFVVASASPAVPHASAATQASDISTPTSCGPDHVGVSPMVLRLPASVFGKSLGTWIVERAEGGYIVLVIATDDDEVRQRIGTAVFSESGQLLDRAWIGDWQTGGGFRPVFIDIDEEERVSIGWNTQPVRLERFFADGTPDRSYGDNGVVLLSIPDREGLPTTRGGVHVSWGSWGAAVFSGQARSSYVVSPDGESTEGPFLNNSIPEFTSLLSSKILVTENGDTFFRTGGGIGRFDLRGNLVSDWAGDGHLLWSARVSSSENWRFDEQTGELILGSGTTPFQLHAISRSGNETRKIEASPALPANLTRFDDGTWLVMTYAADVIALGRAEPLLVSGGVWGPLALLDSNRIAAAVLIDARGRFETTEWHFFTAPPVVASEGAGSSRDAVRRLYAAYFDRQPDTDGLRFWVTRLANGDTLDDISAAFANSPEFTTTYGNLDDQDFINLVYQNVLDRAPDQTGLDFWTTLLNDGGNRGAVMTNFSESTEYITSTRTTPPLVHPREGAVRRLYAAYFDRQPDTDGLCFWVTRLANGDTLDDISAAFANSPEFTTTYGNLDDQDFINLVYQNVLDRAPDQTGLDFWTTFLNDGGNRGAVMTNFSESTEYRRISDLAE